MNQIYLLNKKPGFTQFLILLGFILASGLGYSQNKILILNDSVKEYQVNEYFLMFKDSASQYSIEEISQPSYLPRFQPISSNVYRIEYDKDVKQYWLRLELDNQTDKNEFIFFNLPRFDTLVAYYWLNNQYESHLTGLRTNFKQRSLYITPISHLPLFLQKGKNVIYFQIAGNSLIHRQRGVLDGEIWQAYHAYTYHTFTNFLAGVVGGSLIFMFIFNGVVYTFLRDRLYFIYLFSLLSTIAYLSSFFYYEVTWMAWGIPFYGRYAYVVLCPMMMITSIWFNQAALNTKLHLPSWHQIGNFLKYCAWLIILPLFLGNISLSVNLTYGLALVVICYLLIIVFLRMRQGSMRAGYFLVANLIYLLAGLWYVLMLNRVLPYRGNSFILLPLGESIRTVIFSVALADRVNLLKTEVAQKEQETALANQQKEFQLQLLKDRLQRDLHDNFGWLLTLLVNRLDKMSKQTQAINSQEIKDLGDLARQIIQELRSTLWVIQEENIALQDLEFKIKDLLWQLNPILENLDCRFHTDYPSETQISAIQARNLYRIVQEAIHNSLKYSQAQQLRIDLQVDGQNNLTLKIADNGIGFNPQNTDNQLIKSNYGLQNMQKRAEEIKGNLQINSQKNQGTQVILALPLAMA
jgi:two-component system, sensor histidine kinase LadS